MRSNPDQQLSALKKKFGTNLDWTKVEVPMTYYEVEKYFGSQCDEYEPTCPVCHAWFEFHKNNQIITIYLERKDIIKLLDDDIENSDYHTFANHE
jgi:hypothetical protein